MLFQISKGTKSFGVDTIFEDVQFEVKNVEKIALVGRNGCGKSTLLRCITQELTLDKGEIHQPNNLTIGYLQQETFSEDHALVKDEMKKAFTHVLAVKKELDAVLELMKTDASEKVLDRYTIVEHEFESLNGYNMDAELMTVFTRFGFTAEDLEREIGTFSGGQKTRLAFVRLLLSKPDILLLDEPTNHLDLETIEWLEGYIRKYPKAVLIVSHDREFINDVCTVVYEIEYGHMTRYSGNYDAYVEQKRKDKEKQAQAYSRQQKEIERLSELIEKFRYKKNKAAFAQSKIKYLDRMEKIEKPDRDDTKSFTAHFVPKVKGGKTVLVCEDLTIGYTTPLCTINLQEESGQRIAVIGPNGTGKSTFLKTIMSLVPALSGSFLYGHQIQPGYFDQQLAQFAGAKTVLEELWDEYPDLDRTTIRSVLGRFLFSAEDVFKTVDVLSGGEKVRLSLAKLMLQQPNFLILDEPTNHLDIVGKEALEEALNGYTGTILLVSHDRYFIRKVATSILSLEDGRATYFPYGYDDFVHRNDPKPVIKPKKEKNEERTEEPPKKKPVNLQKEINKLEKQISEKEELLEQKRELRFEPEYYQDSAKMKELDEEIDGIHNDLNHLMALWEEYSVEKEG